MQIFTMSASTLEKFERLIKQRYDMPRSSAGDLNLKDRIQLLGEHASDDSRKSTKNTEKFERLTKKRFDMPRQSAGDLSLKDRIQLFNDRATDTQKKLEKNPFSDTYQKPEYSSSDDRYGRPEAGTLTERRGIAAGNHVSREIFEVCEVISDCGIERPDGAKIITFGQIFSLYTKISDKVVGMLLRARKHGLIHFEGEMLYQRRDEDTIITLLKPLHEIKASMTGSNDPAKCLAFKK